MVTSDVRFHVKQEPWLRWMVHTVDSSEVGSWNPTIYKVLEPSQVVQNVFHQQ